jgi:hypothetical protein
MGFCLFREAGNDTAWFAINVAHVQDIVPQDGYGAPACLIELPFKSDNFMPVAAGALEAIQKNLVQASKIGLNKVEAELLTGQKTLKITPLLINNPNRIALVRELNEKELAAYETDVPVISSLVFMDGITRLLAARPGVFATKANANGKVPILKE